MNMLRDISNDYYHRSLLDLLFYLSWETPSLGAFDEIIELAIDTKMLLRGYGVFIRKQHFFSKAAKKSSLIFDSKFTSSHSSAAQKLNLLRCGATGANRERDYFKEIFVY